MIRFTSTQDVQVRNEDVLLDQLNAFTKRTGIDVLPALGDTVRRVAEGPNGGLEGTLYLTSDLQSNPYWTTETPTDWPHGLIVAQYVILFDNGTEADLLPDA